MRPISRTIQHVATGTLFAVSILGWGIFIVGVADLQPIKINPTNSLPKGIYVRSIVPIRKGSIVWFRLPETMRPYVGQYPEWLAFFDKPGNGLMKPVVAVEGDEICREAATDVFTVAGEFKGVALADGPDGHELPRWRGCRQLGPNEIAVFSDRIPDSLDSRYFGPLRIDEVRTYRPLWTE